MPKGQHEIIKEILEKDSALLEFTKAFHKVLTEANRKREVAAERTETEKRTDALGRLLVGDETCATIVFNDEKIIIASNNNNHSDAVLTVGLKKIIIKAGSTSENLKVVLSFKFTTPAKAFTLQTGVITYHQSAISIGDLSSVYLSASLPETEYIEFTFPYTDAPNAHEIHEYPYPLTLRFFLRDAPGLGVTGVLREDRVIDEENLKPRLFKFTLDPLRRRAEALFHHLGIFAIYYLKKQPVTSFDFKTIINQHRIRVIMQTLGWEAPDWIGLGGAQREYAYPKETPRTRKEKEEKARWDEKKDNLNKFQKFLELLTKDLNDFLKKNAKTGFLITEEIFQWVNEKKQQIEKSSLLYLPSFIKKEKALLFFERARQYFEDIFLLERFIVKKAKKNKKIAKVITSIGVSANYEYFLPEVFLDNQFFIPNAEILIVGDDLTQGVHSEIRVFRYLKENSQLSKKHPIPYFGITMLCCANCHLFLRAHGIDYVEGKRLRAGTHSQHFGNWILDEKITDDDLFPFLGASWLYFEKLTGDFNFKGTVKSRKAWARFIIEHLATLETPVLKALQFKYKKIFQSNLNWHTLRASTFEVKNNTLNSLLGSEPTIPAHILIDKQMQRRIRGEERAQMLSLSYKNQISPVSFKPERHVHIKTLADGNCVFNAIGLGLYYLHSHVNQYSFTKHEEFRAVFANLFNIEVKTFTSDVFAKLIEALSSSKINLQHPLISLILDELEAVGGANAQEKNQLYKRTKLLRNRILHQCAFQGEEIKTEYENVAICCLAEHGELLQLVMAMALREYCFHHYSTQIEMTNGLGGTTEEIIQTSERFGDFAGTTEIAFLAKTFNITISEQQGEFGGCIVHNNKLNQPEMFLFVHNPGQTDCHYELGLFKKEAATFFNDNLTLDFVNASLGSFFSTNLRRGFLNSNGLGLYPPCGTNRLSPR